MPCAEAPAELNVASDEALERPRHARYRAKSGKQPGKLSRAGHISGEAPGSSPEQLGAVGGDATRDVGPASATSQTQELALVARREAAGTHATRLTKHGGSHAGPPTKVLKQADKTTVPKSAPSADAAAPQDMAPPTAPAVASDAVNAMMNNPGPPLANGGMDSFTPVTVDGEFGAPMGAIADGSTEHSLDTRGIEPPLGANGPTRGDADRGDYDDLMPKGASFNSFTRGCHR